MEGILMIMMHMAIQPITMNTRTNEVIQTSHKANIQRQTQAHPKQHCTARTVAFTTRVNVGDLVEVSNKTGLALGRFHNAYCSLPSCCCRTIYFSVTKMLQ